MSKFGCQAHYTLNLDAIPGPELSKSVSVGCVANSGTSQFGPDFQGRSAIVFPDGKGVILGGPFNF